MARHRTDVFSQAVFAAQVGRRIKDLTAEMDALLKKKEEIHAESDGKVTELYHLCHRWEARGRKGGPELYFVRVHVC